MIVTPEVEQRRRKWISKAFDFIREMENECGSIWVFMVLKNIIDIKTQAC